MRRVRANGRGPEGAARGAVMEAAADGAVDGEEMSVSRVGYAPITRVDATRREIELCATSEALDSFGTIFDYDASRDAFTRWIGNVREMHERRAVGSSVAVRCDDGARRVYVRARISRGAQDTWEKVLDGTLRGASIGATNVVWRRERRSLGGRPRTVNVATRYDLAELSLVDNPANPDALGVAIVRDAQPDLTLLDTLDAPLMPGALVERDGDPLDIFAAEAAVQRARREAPGGSSDADGGEGGDAADAAGGLTARETLHAAARTILAGCGCALCAMALAALDAGDGGDEEGEEDSEDAGDAPARIARNQTRAARVMAAALHASARELARMREALREALGPLAAEAVERRDLASTRASTEAEATVEALRARVERLEAQPMPGGPAAHAVARAVEKTLASVPGSFGGADGALTALSALETLAGRLRDPQAQMAVAAEMIRLQQERG